MASKNRVSSLLPGGLLGLPLVAIVGRPNVGKSTLFNRLARERLALVHDLPGVTRDRNYADTSAFGKNYTLIDTGGFDPEDSDPMHHGIARHVREAIVEADVIVFVTDAETPLTRADRAAAGILREAGKPVLYVSNKSDSPQPSEHAYDLYKLGAKHVFAVSALHGRGMGELESAIVDAFPKRKVPRVEHDESIPRIAIVGRPNAGKSSLTNTLLGEARMLVDDKPGTTHDAVGVIVRRGRRSYLFLDTAGMRKKGKVTKADDAVESLSNSAAVKAIVRSHVVVLLCDAAEGVAEQDAKILGLAEARGRALVIGLNKTDLLDADERKKAEEAARDKLSFAPYAPLVHLSATAGKGVSELMNCVDATYATFTKRIGTGELNRFFESVLETHPPPTQGGKAPRLYFITQAEVAPPTFVISASAPDAIHFSYQRYVVNQLRKAFGFEGVPVRVVYRERRRGRKPGTFEVPEEVLEARAEEAEVNAGPPREAPRRPERGTNPKREGRARLERGSEEKPAPKPVRKRTVSAEKTAAAKRPRSPAAVKAVTRRKAGPSAGKAPTKGARNGVGRNR
jgi:GTPase